MKKMFTVKSFLLFRACKDLLLKLSTQSITTDYRVLKLELSSNYAYPLSFLFSKNQLWVKNYSQTTVLYQNKTYP